jgi:outer membrane protein
MKKTILAVLCAVLFSSGTILGQSAQQITLEDAIRISLENNYLLKQAENNLDLADESIRNEQADFLPSLNTNFDGSRTTGQQFIFERFNEGLNPFVDVTSQSFSGSVSANIAIFNGFANIISLRQSQQTQVSREESLQRAREQVIFDTATRFLQVILDEELLKIARENLVTSQRQLEQVQAQVEVGSRPAVDLYNQEATVANDELTITQRENTLALNKLLLVRTLQIDPVAEYDFVVPEIDADQNFSTVESFSLRELIDQAMMTRSDIRSEEASIKSLEYQLLNARAALLPRINGSASISSRYSDQYTLLGESVSFSDQFFDQQVNRSLGLSISIPIFQNYNRLYNIQASRVQLKNAELNLDNSKLQVIQEVTQAYNDYSSFLKQKEATEKSLFASEKAFETQQERYNVGASTLIELSQAQATYVSAQSNYTQSVFSLIFQEILLDFYLGKLSGDTIEF